MNKVRYFIELAYKGTNFHGWQIQPNAVSVQETINKELSKLLRRDVEVEGAGRTDTAVHASFFVAHIDMEENIDIDKIIFKLNCMLPPDIVIFDIKKVPQNAHSRFDAISRTYRYFISKQKNPFLINSAWNLRADLDIAKMNKAAEIMLTYSDFACFCKAHGNNRTTICKLMYAKWTEQNNIIYLEIKADRFLRNMVRAIVGTMIDIGRGKLQVGDIEQILQSKKRSNAGMSAPAKGLFLYDIEYPKEYGIVNSYINIGNIGF